MPLLQARHGHMHQQEMYIHLWSVWTLLSTLIGRYFWLLWLCHICQAMLSVLHMSGILAYTTVGFEAMWRSVINCQKECLYVRFWEEEGQQFKYANLFADMWKNKWHSSIQIPIVVRIKTQNTNYKNTNWVFIKILLDLRLNWLGRIWKKTKESSGGSLRHRLRNSEGK